MAHHKQCLHAGLAWSHLHRWIAAAVTVQRSWRVWRLHQGVVKGRMLRQRLVSAIVRLQALWRARGPRRHLLSARRAATSIQVGSNWCRHV